MLTISIADILGKANGGLLYIVGGEDRGAVKAVGTGESRPLKAHSEKDGIEESGMGHIRGENTQQKRTDERNEGADAMRILMILAVQDYGSHDAENIAQQCTGVKQQRVPLTEQRVKQHLQQVNSLSIAE